MNFPIGGDSAYFIHLYSRYRRDPSSVPADWAFHFEGLEHAETVRSRSSAQGAVEALHQGYRWYGHLEATTDPLATEVVSVEVLNELRMRVAGFAGHEIELAFGGETRRMPADEAAALLKSTYARNVGLEVSHIENEHERAWWYESFEKSFAAEVDAETKINTLESIILVDEFESFMRIKFPTKKRFGSEGAESAIALLREVLRSAPKQGIENVVMGGMHRGRLATLAAALGKNPATLAAELMGRDLSEGAIYTGDVPYHLGFTSSLDVEGKAVNLTLLPHPSHLMVVAPVALGLARATSQGDGDGAGKTLCFLLHTDAAFSGQGVTAELLQLGGLKSYSASGSIHLIVNNQIGFTTLPSEGRSSRYCTDAGKIIAAPILHVNGDDPLAAARVAKLAVDWKVGFERDVLIDLVCYRRFGHNELDEPRFTQPAIWERIEKHPSVRKSFSEALIAEHPDFDGVASEISKNFRAKLQEGFESAADIAPNDEPMQSEAWNRIRQSDAADILAPVLTGVDRAALARIGLETSVIPDSVKANPKVRQFYEARAATISRGDGINFATAEALAFASLLAEGTGIRLSGQDSERGTFTQRHLAVHDMVSGDRYVPLRDALETSGRIEIVNSPLSEYGALAFEYGFSLVDPDRLNLWEAQFGDFLNGAQTVVDQYIASAEAKWRLKSGLTIMLPHGLEGQGPDHSSARIERLTQLCAGANIIVAQPSTPANLFHLLRRQVIAPWRKPLFLIAPKSLLRAKAAVSRLDEMISGTGFRPVMAEPCGTPAGVRIIVMCSGKIFYALQAELEAHPDKDRFQTIRIEQIYPFPSSELSREVAKYRNLERLFWLQEEGENQGGWPYSRDQLAAALGPDAPAITLIARPCMAVTAAGSIERHEREQKELFARLLKEQP
ncbi:2-oxoglutarate dehydrogenase E1 component [Bosea thiooxidans]